MKNSLKATGRNHPAYLLVLLEESKSKNTAVKFYTDILSKMVNSGK